MKLIMISTDRKILDVESSVAKRQIDYARNFEEVHIIIFTRGKEVNKSLSPNCHIYPTNSRSKLFYIHDAIKIGRKIINKSFFITCQDLFLTGLVGMKLKKDFTIPLEVQIHTDFLSPYFTKLSFQNRLYILFAKKVLPCADTIRVVSEKIKKSVETLNMHIPIEVRPIKVDEEKIKNALITIDVHKKYPQFKKIVLMVGRLEKEKNYEMAIEAFKSLNNLNVGLVIVGNGKLKFKNENNIIFEGWSDQIYSYMKTADLFLHTSWYEGYGLVLKEAQIAGLPIVSTDVGIAREVGAEIVDWNVESIRTGIMKYL